ncbi:MAG: hypothetical protein EZS28_009061 [Streblomastix strix]|uniref:F-box domain-containing protein n=1 Tax=Streblomastix strix TaxID=222440 RepID=A0A5J4WKR7_9EUKA|nr:MAG: hypothetical protein EZS28_009061 [Streblomastix strix]
MDNLSDYNVDGSLLGLGEFILLEILSEMAIPQDVQQFLIVCRKIHKLQEHPRFEKIIYSIVEIIPIFIIMEGSQGSSEKNKFFHSDEYEPCTIAIDPIISEGIVRIEVLVLLIHLVLLLLVVDLDDQKTVRYYQNGDIAHINNGTNGNQKYADGQRVAVEVDMTSVPRRAAFFVDDVEQPNFVIGIPEAIRFWVYTFDKSSSFTVTKFERLIKSTSQGVYGSKALEWGKSWKSINQ